MRPENRITLKGSLTSDFTDSGFRQTGSQPLQRSRWGHQPLVLHPIAGQSKSVITLPKPDLNPRLNDVEMPQFKLRRRTGRRSRTAPGGGEKHRPPEQQIRRRRLFLRVREFFFWEAKKRMNVIYRVYWLYILVFFYYKIESSSVLLLLFLIQVIIMKIYLCF